MARKSSKRGLASASEETKERVSRAGGQASHGGGRSKESSDWGSTSGRKSGRKASY